VTRPPAAVVAAFVEAFTITTDVRAELARAVGITPVGGRRG